MINHQITHRGPPKHFYILDSIRGIAALAVVLWHWQHFYYVKTTLPATFSPARQPLFKFLHVFYTNGAYAVDFFFLLSGFIFFYLYGTKVSQKNITPIQFAIARLSRLYPLHFVTLLAVLIIQSITFFRTGYYNIYADNDAYHFVLNLFFAASWGLEKGSSFNGPVWSVSVEVLLYILFFIVCRLKLNTTIFIGFLILLALVIQPLYSPLGRGLFSFFAGGLVCYQYLKILKNNQLKAYLKWLRLLCIIMAAIVIGDVYWGFIEKTGIKLAPFVLKNKSDEAIIKIIEAVNHTLVKAIFFPCIILFLALYETLKGKVAQSIALIGNISYSSYLLQFPLQLLLISYCHETNVALSLVADSPLTLLGFYVILIVLSFMSFKYFELPLQKYIREKAFG